MRVRTGRFRLGTLNLVRVVQSNPLRFHVRSPKGTTRGSRVEPGGPPGSVGRPPCCSGPDVSRESTPRAIWRAVKVRGRTGHQPGRLCSPSFNLCGLRVESVRLKNAKVAECAEFRRISKCRFFPVKPRDFTVAPVLFFDFHLSS